MMSEAFADIEQLVKTLVVPLVDSSDEVELSSEELEDGSLLIEIRCNAEDAGKIIGRQGRVIKAIRTLCRAAGSRHGFHVEVELIDS